MSNSVGCSETDITHAASVLEHYRGASHLPPELFAGVAGASVTATVELVPLIRHEEDFSVVLVERSHEEMFWPGILHVPGKVLLPSDPDGSFAIPLQRLVDQELGGADYAVEPVSLGLSFGSNERGKELRVRFWSILRAVPPLGVVCMHNAYPQNFLVDQAEMITSAINQAHRYALDL